MYEAALGAVAAINLLTFILFGVDKRRARLQRRRIPEATLILFATATGCIGGWIAMSVFRHKTHKLSFQIKMVLATLANGLWIYLWFRMNGS